MSEHHLPRVARRILNRPQLISERGALAVLGAIAPRLGIGRVCDAGGAVLELPAGLEKSAGNVGAPERHWDSDQPFAFNAENGIAYIPVEGELVHRYGYLEPSSGMTGYDAIKFKVQAAAGAPQVKGILVDFDSPGGEVYGCQGAAEVIFEARQAKPIWALVNEQATSAAYWLASAAHAVFAPTTADAGSIGVVMVHVDISQALAKEGLTVTLIHAGEHKVDGHPFAPLPDAVHAELQAELAEVHTLFAGAVARNRGLSVEAVLGTEARVYMAPAAVEAGLVDAVASEDEVVEEFAALLARHQPAALPRKP